MLALLPPLFFMTVLMGSPVPGFLVFFLLGIWSFLTKPSQPNAPAWTWSREDTGIALCFMSIPAFKLLSSLWSDAPQLALMNAGWHLYFFFWPLVFLGLKRCNDQALKTERAIPIGIIVFALYATSITVTGDSLRGTRQNVGILAQLTMVVGIWNAIALTRGSTLGPWRALHSVALLASFLVLVLSTRRLELIGFIALLALLALYRLREQLTLWRSLGITALGLAALALLIYARRNNFAEGFSELKIYLYERQTHPEVIFTSWGARLEMWRTAWAAFIDHPLLGIGASARPYAMQAWGGPDDMAAFGHRHFHSHLLQTLVEGGLVGLALLCITLGYTSKHMIIRAHALKPEAAILAAGLLGAYVMEGLASAALQYDKPNALLVVASAWVWLYIRSDTTPSDAGQMQENHLNSANQDG